LSLCSIPLGMFSKSYPVTYVYLDLAMALAAEKVSNSDLDKVLPTGAFDKNSVLSSSTIDGCTASLLASKIPTVPSGLVTANCTLPVIELVSGDIPKVTPLLNAWE